MFKIEQFSSGHGRKFSGNGFHFFKLDTDIFQMKLTVNFITETDRQLINKID